MPGGEAEGNNGEKEGWHKVGKVGGGRLGEAVKEMWRLGEKG